MRKWLLLVLVALTLPGAPQGYDRSPYDLTACKSNLKNIGTACEMYATDHKGRYPASLAQLSPAYLRSTPTCPAAARDTYSGSYQAQAQPASYAFCCQGHFHQKAYQQANHPAYNSVRGLVSDPVPAAVQAARDADTAREPAGALKLCEGNLRTIGTALEMYSTDFAGRYPAKMSLLVPNYLKSMPTCSACRRETYSFSYKVTAKPDTYAFCCFGLNHQAAGLSRNQPAYNSAKGLVKP